MTTSTCSASAASLPANILPFPRTKPQPPKKRTYLPLDPTLVEMLGSDAWKEVGVSCRMALAGFRLEGDDLVQALGELIDEDASIVEDILKRRANHFKVMQRALSLLREADRREGIALDKALAERGA